MKHVSIFKGKVEKRRDSGVLSDTISRLTLVGYSIIIF